ncbi:MAG: UDP-3-O-(3-hydroxymyristoyl)glucosamine N-acyltransferase [Ignavibacteria bacterium]|nr:UDP-3-O-(3-hydroxymyristoyl)glucosamine N-acyltransferase [Ignavibacteria bacterium]
MKLKQIAEILGGTIEGNPEQEVSHIAEIEHAGVGEITFISNPVYAKYYETTKASAIIVAKNFEAKDIRTDITLIRVEDPYMCFVNLLELFSKDAVTEEISISALSSVGKNSTLGENISIGDFTTIGKDCTVGMNTRICSNVSVGNGVSIGENSYIGSNVVIYRKCKIGNNVIIHSGTVIGSDGFGFAKNKDGSYKKIPQTGIVLIDDDVEIGSNCCIDRATIGETHICRGVKMDNQIQIAHNVVIGEDSIIISQVGIAGSTKIGKRCIIAGQAGIVGHLTICDDVVIGAAVGVTKSITKPGVYAGYRFKPIKENLKEEAYIKEIPFIKEKLKIIEKSLNKDK